MNIRIQFLAMATAVTLCATGLYSCKDYSSDEPLPDVYTQTLYVSSNNQIVYALDPLTGEKKWQFSVDGEVHATPLVYNNKVYIATATGVVYKLNTLTGEQEATRSFGAAIEGTPLVRNGVLIVPSGTTIYAVDPGTLNDYFVSPHVLSYNIGGIINASPTVHDIDITDGSQALIVAGANNKVVALNQDLAEVWTATAPDAGAFYSSPCVVNNKYCYIGNDNGYMYCFNTTASDSLAWKYKTGGQVRSSPIQIGGNVLFGSNDRNFYSVDSATGLLRWKVLTGDAVESSPAVYNQYVYFGSYDAHFYCVDIIDGTVNWEWVTAGLIKSSPLIYNGDVYFGGFDKNLYRLDASTGAQKMFPVDIYGQMETSPIIDTVGGAVVPSISGSYKW
ncbi:MAG: PQQ-binding-like beta-propeller repeat protein [Edaphocola sp.]